MPQPWEMDWGGQQATGPAPWEMDWGGQQQTPDLKERAKALSTGITRGAVNFAGMPADTIANLVDLAKAGYGAAGKASGLLSTEQMPQLSNRAGMPLTSEWLASKIGQMGGAQAIENPNVQDQLSRLLYAGGQAAAPVLFGGGGAAGPASAARNVLMGGMGNVAGQGAAEADLPPSAQLLAQMAVPAVAAKGAQIGLAEQQKLAQSQATNAVRDQSIREAQKAGYVIPPMQVHPEAPGATNRLISAVGLKVPMEQEFSIRNIGITDSLAKKYVGIPQNESLTEANLAQIRHEAGKAYDVVKQTGSIPIDGQYVQDIQSINNQYLKGAQGNRTLASKDAELAIQDATKPVFTGDQSVYLVRKLREAGFKNEKTDNVVSNTTGTVQLGLSKALDGLIGRHLQQNGTPQQYADYLNARETIAKAHTIENVLNPATGHVDARKLANEWQKGAPLSAEGLQIAKAASVIPQATQQVTSANPGLGTLLGWGGLGAVGAATTGNPAYLAAQAIPLLRPGARHLAMSGPYQRMMVKPPSYQPGIASRLLPEVFNPDLSGLLGAYAVPYQ